MITLIQYYYDYFINDDNDGYRLLYSSVCIDVCNGLYNRFIKDGSMPPIESLDDSKKKSLWEKASEFYTEKNARISAAKAAYVLQTITSKNV